MNEVTGPIVVLENEVCAPRPVVLAIPQPKHEHGFYFPFHVKLYRCIGACNAQPIITQCAAKGILKPCSTVMPSVFSV